MKHLMLSSHCITCLRFLLWYSHLYRHFYWNFCPEFYLDLSWQSHIDLQGKLGLFASNWSLQIWTRALLWTWVGLLWMNSGTLYFYFWMTAYRPSTNISMFQGATIKRDESTGAIIVARVMRGGAADRSGEMYFKCINIVTSFTIVF